ncbi:hypothetical protein ACFX11_032798 [Malus domestica]
MTATTGMEDGTWSDGKMEGDGGLRTLECLRGRLLAERQASRVAKEDAELIGKKLVELQKQLKEEIKLKEKAEKKLKYLKKKLESLNISSKNSEKSCTQSTTTSSGSNHPETHEAKSKVAESEIPEESRQNAADSTTSEQSHESTFTEENTCSQSTSGSSSSSSLECSSPKGFCHNPTHKSEDPGIEDSNRQVLDTLRASPPHAQRPAMGNYCPKDVQNISSPCPKVRQLGGPKCDGLGNQSNPCQTLCSSWI